MLTDESTGTCRLAKSAVDDLRIGCLISHALRREHEHHSVGGEARLLTVDNEPGESGSAAPPLPSPLSPEMTPSTASRRIAARASSSVAVAKASKPWMGSGQAICERVPQLKPAIIQVCGPRVSVSSPRSMLTVTQAARVGSTPMSRGFARPGEAAHDRSGKSPHPDLGCNQRRRLDRTRGDRLALLSHHGRISLDDPCRWFAVTLPRGVGDDENI